MGPKELAQGLLLTMSIVLGLTDCAGTSTQQPIQHNNDECPTGWVIIQQGTPNPTMPNGFICAPETPGDYLRR